MRKVKVGMIGTGSISYVHGKQLKTLEDAAIEAIADPRVVLQNLP